MEDYQDILYKKTYLSQVILRIDFLQYIESANIFCAEIEKVILSLFPRREMDQLIRFNSINLNFETESGIPNASGQVLEGIQKTYLSLSGKIKIILSNKFIIFEINEYSSFDNLYSWAKQILYSITRSNSITAERTGIRYINIYRAEQIKLRKNMFEASIAASLINEANNEYELTRSMHMKEYTYPPMSLNFRYGLFNPDYPSALRKNDFVLDYDCFSQEPLDSVDSMLQCIKKGHQGIQTIFEQSITDSLRKVMRDE